MTIKQPLRLILAANLISLILSALLLSKHLHMDLSAEQAQGWGGNLSMLLLILGITCHFQAKKGRFLAGPATLIAAFPPLFLYMAGPLRQVIGFHILVAAIHGFILWNLAGHHKKRTDELTP